MNAEPATKYREDAQDLSHLQAALHHKAVRREVLRVDLSTAGIPVAPPTVVTLATVGAVTWLVRIGPT